MSSIASFFRQILVLIPVFIGSFFSGLGYSWMASYMILFQSGDNTVVPYTIQQCTLLVLLLHVGRISGTFVNIFLLRKLGLKTPLIIANSLYLISAGMVLIDTLYLVVALSRFVNGFAYGLNECFASIYLGEISSKNIRGMVCSSSSVFFSLGVLTQYALGTYLSYSDGAIVRITLGILLVLSTYCLIESPYYLKPLNPNEALKTIAWLRAIKLKQAEKELEDIVADDINVKGFFTHFRKPEILKSFGILLTLGFISTLLCVLVNSFANLIIPETEFLNSHQFAILLSIIPSVMSVLSAMTIDRLGRRLLLLIGFSLGIFLNAIITVLYFLQEKSFLKIANFSWIIFSIIVLFYIIHFLTICPTVNALRAELFPTSYKVVGISIAIIISSLAFSFGAVFFLRVVKVYGMYLNFLIYCICCCLGLILVYVYLPETKGKSLAEIQEMLKSSNKMNP